MSKKRPLALVDYSSEDSEGSVKDSESEDVEPEILDQLPEEARMLAKELAASEKILTEEKSEDPGQIARLTKSELEAALTIRSVEDESENDWFI